MRTNLATLAAFLCLATGTASAIESGMYFDINAGAARIRNLNQSSLDSDIAAIGTLNGSSLDDKGITWAATVGYRFNPYLAADLGWTSLGTQTYKASFLASGLTNNYEAKLESRGITAAATGILPIAKRFELRGRAGLFFANTAINRENRGGSVLTVGYTEEDSVELFASVAAAFKFTPKFSIYAGVQHFNQVGAGDTVGESNINSAIVGVTFRQ